jgi:hypothetical protein
MGTQRRDSTEAQIQALRKNAEEWRQWIRENVPRVWQRWCGRSIDYQNHPTFLDAEKFSQNFEPKDGCDYKWAIEYAKESYQQLDHAFRYLDEKADAIIKYLGGGTAVITVAALATVNRYNAWLPILLLPSFGCALAAIALANAARRPRTHPGPPPITEAINYAEAYSDKAEATFLGLWHQCCEGLHIANTAKAGLVGCASRCYWWALFCLLLPALVWPIWNVVSPPPKVPIQVEIIKGADNK